MDLRPLAAPTVVALAATYGLLLELASAAGLFGLWLGLIVALSLWRYGYALLGDVARGKRNLPPPSIETMNPVGERGFLLHFVLFVSLFYLLFTTPLLGDGAPAIVVRVAGAAAALGVFPASAAILGMTRNVAAAVDPRALANVVRVMGRGYARLLGVCVVIVLGAAVLSALLAERGLLANLLVSALGVWTLLAIFAATGAAVHEHGAELDVQDEEERRSSSDSRDRERSWQRTLDLAYASIRSGLVEQGYGSIKQLLAAEHHSLEIYQWIFNRMAAWEDRRFAADLGVSFVARLLEDGRLHTALELAHQCARLSSAFALPQERMAQLVQYARSIGRHRAADELCAAGAANRALVGVLGARDEPGAAAVREVLPEPAQRDQ